MNVEKHCPYLDIDRESGDLVCLIKGITFPIDTDFDAIVRNCKNKYDCEEMFDENEVERKIKEGRKEVD